MVDTYKTKLVEYLKKNMKKGYPIDTLKIALINQGYVRTMVEAAAKIAVEEMAKEAPVLENKPEIKSEVVIEEPIVEKKSFWKKISDLFKK